MSVLGIRDALIRIAPRWFRFPGRYALWRMGIRYNESRGYNQTNRILLTFDDEGTAENIRGILKALRKDQVKAFFFLNGKWAEQNKKLVKEIAAAGHWIGSHTYSHKRLSRLSDEEIREEMRRGLQTKVMRPPYGDYDTRVRGILHKMGFRIVYWTIDSLDWKGIGAAHIRRNVLASLHPGACVLMHLNTPHTLEALPGIIAGIRSKGYQLCTDGSELVASLATSLL